MNFEKDVENKDPSQSIKAISNLVTRAKELEVISSEKEKDLAEVKRDIDNIYKTLIPGLMSDFGLDSVTTHDGFKVNIKHTLRASLSKAKLHEGCNWLMLNGHDHVIKNEIKVEFKAGAEGQAKDLREQLERSGFTVIQKRSVHAGTLSSLIKELKEDNLEVPEDLMGVYEFDEAKVK